MPSELEPDWTNKLPKTAHWIQHESTNRDCSFFVFTNVSPIRSVCDVADSTGVHTQFSA